MSKRILSFILCISILSCLINVPILATEERWIDVVIGEEYTVENILDDQYEGLNKYQTVKYYVYPDFDYGTNYDIIAVFSEKYLNTLFPNTSLVGKRMQIKIPFTGVNQTSKTIWNVTDYKYEIEENKPNLNVEIIKKYYSEDDISYYYAKDLQSEKIILLKIAKQVGDFYYAIGEKLSIYTGDSFLFHGKTTYSVNKYIPYQADKENLDLYNPQITEYIGVLKEVFLLEQNKQKITYLLEDISGEKEYLAFFDIAKEDYSTLHSFYQYSENEKNNLPTKTEEEKIQVSEKYYEEINEYQVGRKIKIYGYVEGESNNKEIIVVKDYLFIDDTYTKHDKESVYLNGTIELNYKNTKEQSIYSFISSDETNSTYYLVFDENVLGNKMPAISLLGKKMSIYGVINKENENYYVGVMSYGIINEANEQDSSYSIKEVSLSRILEETNDSIIYFGIDNTNKKEKYVFSKSYLNINFPNYSLTNKTFNIAYLEQTDANYVLAYNEIIKDNQEYYEKGVLLYRLNRNYTTAEYLFQNSFGEQLIAIIPLELENKFLSETDIVQNIGIKNKTVYIFGNISTYDGTRKLVVKDLEETNELYINKSTADVITFTGTISNLISEKLTGSIYNITNEYEQSTIIYFDKETLGENYPQSDLTGSKLTIRGIKYSNGILLITDYVSNNVPIKYPDKQVATYTNPINFPNMEGFTGLISILNIDKTYYTLTTSKSRYILLFENENIEKLLQTNLNNVVYLRGQPDVMGDSFWSNRIKVYDIQPVCLNKNNCTTIVNPVNSQIPDYKPDPQKNAIHTIQINEPHPENYEYGKGILESLYIPTEDVTNLIKEK